LKPGGFINVLKPGDFEDDLNKSLLEMKYTIYQPLSNNGDLKLSSFFVTGMMRIGFGESSKKKAQYFDQFQVSEL